MLPAFLNPTRKVVRDLSGQQKVPVLRLDDGEIITGSGEIVAWAREHPPSRA
jgi:glutathione S-transferase